MNAFPMIAAQRNHPLILELQERVAAHYGINPLEMLSERRNRAISRPRQVAMYLCRHLTLRSLPEIGRRFGGRDHTTVIHAIKRIEALMETDVELAADVRSLRGRLA